MNDDVTPTISVVIGRVSTEDDHRVLETLAALRPEAAGGACEIVVADRIGGAVSARIACDYPEVILIPCAPETTLPDMRTRAYEASTGAIVAVTEDHCVPGPGWIATLACAFANGPPALAAVGGSVVNGVTDTGLDWATFLCEYSFFCPPVAEGKATVLPGMNVGYRRSLLDAAPRERLTSGFWETTLHPALLAAGGEFLSRNDLIMFHKKRFSWQLFAAQRFIYSRYYAGLRFGGAAFPKRVAACAASLLLPPILFWRMIRAVRAKGFERELMVAMPWLAMFVVIWSIGESVGALLGPGDALARIE